MRTLFALALVLLLASAASAATLNVEVNRQGFTGAIEVAVAPRVGGTPPEWSAAKTLPAGGGKSAVSFEGLPAGLYVVMASGPQPLQRLSAKVNLGSDGGTVRLVIPKKSNVEVRAMLAGQPLARAGIGFTHHELRWRTDVVTDREGRFAGPLWEEGTYTASVRRHPASGPYSTDVWLSSKPVTIAVPDRHVTGRVLAGGKPLAGAIVDLRSENNQATLTVRTPSSADGRFEFFGVREGALSLTARAPSYLDSDAIAFELRGATGQRSVDVELMRGETRAVRVVDTRGTAIGGATLIAACGGHMKSTSVTNEEGNADVAFPADRACTIYALPKEGSLAIVPVGERGKGASPLVIRVPEGASSLRLALKSEAGVPFAAMSLLMRIDGVVIPPAIARLLASRGFSLITNEEGGISLQRIPRGVYDFWPYRHSAEGQMLYETAMDFAAPISVEVLPGENEATVKFQAR
ncbi:MAG TPA: carboxypeptidase-like regulatory domain-containing protein [Thermoanaerobaculia bacterium]|jgi:hypothetical protein